MYLSVDNKHMCLSHVMVSFMCLIKVCTNYTLTESKLTHPDKVLYNYCLAIQYCIVTYDNDNM